MFRGAFAALVLALGLAVPGVAHAYGWPVKPFDRMHPIRGTFDDPRFHLSPDLTWKGTFHFGVDISAPDGTAVYAVESGTITRGPDWVDVHRQNRRVFGYWHVRPVVSAGAHVRKHQLLGYILPGWGHVHFADSVAGHYRDPLRKGALTPYRENAPVVDSISVVAIEAHALQSESPDVSGTIGLIASAYQLPWIAPAPPWNRARLVPSVVRWRLISADGDPPTPWHTVADFRYRLLPGSQYATIYAPGTYQNKANRPGLYRFWLAQAFDTRSLPNGTYWIDVEAANLRGAVGENELQITVAN